MKPALFYGWKVIMTLFVMLMFSSGFGFYNHSVIIQALVRDGGFDIELASMAVSVFFLTSGLSGLAIAPLLERYDVRYVVAVGVLLTSVSLSLLGSVSSMAELLVLYIFFGAGFGAAGLLPATTLVARWFELERAKALSIASTGLSVGGVLLTPMSATLIETYTLQTAGLWLGILNFVFVMPLVLYYLRSSPKDLGLLPDGQKHSSSAGSLGMHYRDALRQYFFWGLAISYVLTMLAQVGGIAHQYGVLSERLSSEYAAWGIAIMPAFSVAGRLAGGMILDRISTLRFTLVMMLIQGSSLVAIGLSDQVMWMYLSLAVFGVSVGNLLMLQPLIIAEVYGLKYYARLYSWSNLITMTGVSGGPFLLGWLSGYSGGYQIPYIVAGGLGLLSAALFAFLKTPAVTDAQTTNSV
ncbi:MAG: MFS family permease [Candidatus Azotimanducaceae bacterium]|jgi:MFS family permease